MFSAMTSHINKLSDIIKNQKLSLTSGIIVVATSVLNRFLDKSFFKCPHAAHELYGWTFLICPGILLAILTLLSSSRLSRAVIGCCQKDNDVSERAKGGKRMRTWRFIIRNFSIAFAMAMLSFLSWVIMTLLTTEAYVCIKVGPADKKVKDKSKYDTTSKVAGLILLAVGLLVALFINLIIQCCFTDRPEKELLSMHSYDKIEAQAASKELKVLITKSADARGKEMVKTFLRNYQNSHDGNRKPSEKESQGEGVENVDEVYSRENIEALRRFLALRYPRLDGDENFEYCRQDEVPETFDFDKVDAPPMVHQVPFKVTTEVPFAIVEDGTEVCQEPKLYHTNIVNRSFSFNL